jgi:hypothetical protein
MDKSYMWPDIRGTPLVLHEAQEGCAIDRGFPSSVGVELHVAVLPVAVQIGGSPLHGAPSWRHVGLVCLIEDGGHGHHQVGIIVGDGVRLVEEVCVEELIVEIDNGRNVVVVRAA